MRFFEDIEIGQRREVGSFTFTADGIKKFAGQFDPQPFHLDEEEGRKSLFGGLAASSWHVASACMKLLVADRGLFAARVGEAPRMGHPAGPQHRHQPARRTGVFSAGDGLCAKAERRFLKNCAPSLRGAKRRPRWLAMTILTLRRSFRSQSPRRLEPLSR